MTTERVASAPSRKVVFLTAGAAGMYCGSCMRDNTLARHLIDLGWKVDLVPAYTPIRTEDRDVSIDKVFFGGINMFLLQNLPLSRRLPESWMRWLDAPKLIRRAAGKQIKVDPNKLGAMTLSTLEGESGVLQREHEKFVQWLLDNGPIALLCLSNLLIGGTIPLLRREFPNVPIVVTLQGDDLFLDQLDDPWRPKVIAKMRDLAKEVACFITFSRFYATKMGQLFGVPPERFRLVQLGVETAPYEKLMRSPDRPPTVGYFGRICPEKGFHHAVEGFIELSGMRNMAAARFRYSGWLGRQHEVFLAKQREKIDAAGLSGRCIHLSNPDSLQKRQFFREVDLISLPTDVEEPKGLPVLEALASGLPVVVPNHGIFPELLEGCPSACWVEPRNPQALAQAWWEVLSLSDRGRTAGERGRAFVRNRATAEIMARQTAQVFSEVLSS